MLRNGFYNVAAGVVRMGMALLTIPLLIHFIGIEEYGLWALVSAVVGLVALAEAGLSTATTVFVSQDLGRDDRAGLSQTLTVTLGAMLILATLTAISLWFNADAIVNWFPKLAQPQQIAAIRSLQIGGFVVWARLLQQVLIGVEQAYQRYGLLNLLNTAQWTLMSLGLGVIAWQGGHVVALMQWQAIVSSASLVSHAWVVRSLIQPANLCLSWNSTKGSLVVRYSLMTWLTSLGGALFARGDRLIVGSLLGSQVLGVYAAITDITGTINGLSALPVQPLLPTLSQLIVQKDANRVELQRRVKQALEINGFIALGLGAALFMLAPLIMQLMVASCTSNENILAFRLATIIYSFYSVNAVGYYVLFSVDGLKQSMAIHLISGVLALLLILIGSHFFGLMGAMLGNSGYLGVWLLTIEAMKCLNIAARQWLKWLRFPLIWFLGTTIIGFLFANQMQFLFCITLLQTGILLKWFIDSQPQSIRSLWHQFNVNRS
ncbi:MAG: oligosaccharide flippase family protein [Myxacorys chilensis ATA2-1-KO14]|nr:oligosaccharide flippase family protein [Myxacorys chilensis ATA2-1-KO14]